MTETRNKSILVGLAAWGMLSILHASFALSQAVSVFGSIVEATTFQPIPDATIVLLETGQKQSTDDQGRFSYRNLASGSYTISVHHVAFAETERRIVVSQGQPDSIVITLERSILRSDEVIVRSLRTSSCANESPFPMEVLTSERLLDHYSVSIPALLRRSPGISLVRDGSWETAVSMRGLSRSNVVTLIDNTKIETATDISGALSLVNVQDLDRVEANKSPGSVLYGTGALGGVLQLVSKRPSFTEHFQSGVQWTSGASSVDGCLSQYLATNASTDRYALRLSGGIRKAGNTETPLGPLANSMYSDFSLNGSLNVRVVGDQSLLVFYQRNQAEDTGIPGGAPIAPSASAKYTLAKRELFGLQYDIPNLSPRIELVSIRLSRQEIDRNVEIIQSPILTLTPHAAHLAGTLQVEARVRAMNENLLVVGMEAWQRSLDSKRERIDRSLNQITGERPVPESRFFSTGVYAQDEWSVVPGKLVSTLGFRYDWINIWNDKAFNPEYVVVSGITQTSPANQTILWNAGSFNNESWSAEAGTRYSLHPNVDLTFLASTAFRSPSLEERFQYIDLGNVVRLGNPNLKPERSTCLNSGVRVHAQGWRIQSDIFLNRLTNLVSDVPSVYEGRAAFVKLNIGESRIYGYEISYDQLLTTWVALKTSIAYVRGEDTHNRANLPQIAPIDGELSLTGYVTPFGTLDIAATIAGTQNNLAQGELRSAGYAVFNVEYTSMPWNVGRLSITTRAGVENCFNRDYQNHLSTLRGFVKSEPGRNVFLSVTCTY